MSTPEPSTNPSTVYPWDQLPDESQAAFNAFRIYRDLGDTRSLSRVATELIERGRRSGKARTVRTNLSVWSVRHRWVERVQAWDRHLDRLEQVQMARDRKEMRKRQAEAAQLGQVVLTVPFRAALRKLNQNADAALKELSEEELSELISLSAQAARAFPQLVSIERQARGEDVPVHEEWASDISADRVSEEERLRRVAVIMAEHNLLPPAAGDGPPDIVIEPKQEEDT